MLGQAATTVATVNRQRSSERSSHMAPPKPNYRQARSDRNRAREQKKQERLGRRERDSLDRKAAREMGPDELADPPQGGLAPSPPVRDR